jgi:hypothetical protein
MKKEKKVEVPKVVKSKLSESDDNTTEIKNTYEQTIKDNS